MVMVNFKLRISALLAATLLCANFRTAYAQVDSSVDSILLLMQVQDSIDFADDTATFCLDTSYDEEFIVPPENTSQRSWFKRNIRFNINWNYILGFVVVSVIFCIYFYLIPMLRQSRENNEPKIFPVVKSLAGLVAVVGVAFVIGLLHEILPLYLCVLILSVILFLLFLAATKPKSRTKNDD